MRYQTELMRRILTNPKAQEIIDYVSPIYGESYVGLWIYQAIGTVLDEVCTIAEQLRYETNASTSEILLELWERRYGLLTDTTQTPEQRRARILAKKQSKGACNPARLAAAVSAALGGVQVEVVENAARNTFHVHVLEPVDSTAPAVAVIDKMKPAHLIYEITVLMRAATETDIKTAVAMTHAESFHVPVVDKSGDEPDVYIDGNTLVYGRSGASVDGNTLKISGTIVGNTLVI